MTPIWCLWVPFSSATCPYRTKRGHPWDISIKRTWRVSQCVLKVGETVSPAHPWASIGDPEMHCCTYVCDFTRARVTVAPVLFLASLEQRHDQVVTELNQPLLISKGRWRKSQQDTPHEPILLVPQLCNLTGTADLRTPHRRPPRSSPGCGGTHFSQYSVGPRASFSPLALPLPDKTIKTSHV